MLPNSNTSPPATLKAIEDYSRGVGTLFDIASTLNVPTNRFQELLEWYILLWREDDPDAQPSPQTLLNIILIHETNTLRTAIAKLNKKIATLEAKLKHRGSS